MPRERRPGNLVVLAGEGAVQAEITCCRAATVPSTKVMRGGAVGEVLVGEGAVQESLLVLVGEGAVQDGDHACCQAASAPSMKVMRGGAVQVSDAVKEGRCRGCAAREPGVDVISFYFCMIGVIVGLGSGSCRFKIKTICMQLLKTLGQLKHLVN